ncbi:MAG: hypothetical protein P4L22_01785 [Candidatus Babeliales bacterium]|nr:hypothetical protein [Candidatus Babeliales bacterium]
MILNKNLIKFKKNAFRDLSLGSIENIFIIILLIFTNLCSAQECKENNYSSPSSSSSSISCASNESINLFIGNLRTKILLNLNSVESNTPYHDLKILFNKSKLYINNYQFDNAFEILKNIKIKFADLSNDIKDQLDECINDISQIIKAIAAKISNGIESDYKALDVPKAIYLLKIIRDYLGYESKWTQLILDQIIRKLNDNKIGQALKELKKIQQYKQISRTRSVLINNAINLLERDNYHFSNDFSGIVSSYLEPGKYEGKIILNAIDDKFDESVKGHGKNILLWSPKERFLLAYNKHSINIWNNNFEVIFLMDIGNIEYDSLKTDQKLSLLPGTLINWINTFSEYFFLNIESIKFNENESELIIKMRGFQHTPGGNCPSTDGTIYRPGYTRRLGEFDYILSTNTFKAISSQSQFISNQQNLPKQLESLNDELIEHHLNNISSYAFSSSDDRLAIISNKGSVEIFDRCY